MKNQVKKVVLTIAAFVAVNVIAAVLAPEAKATTCVADACGQDTCSCASACGVDWVERQTVTTNAGFPVLTATSCINCDTNCAQHMRDLYTANKTCYVNLKRIVPNPLPLGPPSVEVPWIGPLPPGYTLPAPTPCVVKYMEVATGTCPDKSPTAPAAPIW